MQDARGLFLMLKVWVFMGFVGSMASVCGSRCLGTAWFSLALMADRVLSVVFFLLVRSVVPLVFLCGLLVSALLVYGFSLMRFLVT